MPAPSISIITPSLNGGTYLPHTLNSILSLQGDFDLQWLVIDGGSKVTLSGNNANRILYQNTCDQSLHYTSTHCQAQDTPHLVLQNIGFTAGSAQATKDILGGGARARGDEAYSSSGSEGRG